MPTYELRLTTRASDDVNKLTPQLRDRVEDRIEALATDPRPHGALKLAGRDEWRVRVGDYRVIYAVDDRAQLVEVRRVRRRGVAYHR